MGEEREVEFGADEERDFAGAMIIAELGLEVEAGVEAEEGEAGLAGGDFIQEAGTVGGGRQKAVEARSGVESVGFSAEIMPIKCVEIESGRSDSTALIRLPILPSIL
ncbi:MAG: hypothetical protein AAF570_26890 [Bacteroidota bacterium]